MTDEPSAEAMKIAWFWAVPDERIKLAEAIDAFAALAVARERERCAWWASAFAVHPDADSAVRKIREGAPKP